MSSRRNGIRRIVRHPDVALASVRYHGRRVVTRPHVTVFWVVVSYGFVVGLAMLATDPTGLQLAVEEGLSVATVRPLLPPATFLLVLVPITIVAIPVGIVSRGLRRDLRSSRSRRRRLGK